MWWPQTAAILGIPTPAAGRATFTITGKPVATIEEVVEEPPMNSGN